jgi:hypothetical protein
VDAPSASGTPGDAACRGVTNHTGRASADHGAVTPMKTMAASKCTWMWQTFRNAKGELETVRTSWRPWCRQVIAYRAMPPLSSGDDGNWRGVTTGPAADPRIARPRRRGAERVEAAGGRPVAV